VAALICLFLIPGFAKAQLREGLNLPDHDSRLFRFGIQLGVNRSHFSFTHSDRFLTLNGAVNDSVLVVESLNSTGLNLAWLVDMNLNEHFDLRTFPLNLVFTEKAFQYHLKYPDGPAGESKVTTKKIQGITLTLPLQIKFSSDRINNFKVYMIGGGKIEYDLAANAGARKAESLVKLKPFDYGIEGGIGFHFYFPYFVLTPELKIGWGLANLHSKDENLKYSNVIDKINSRTVSLSITVE